MGVELEMATGIYHKYNVFTYRVLKVLLEIYPKQISARELGTRLGVTQAQMNDRLQVYTKCKLISRSTKKYKDPVTGYSVRMIRIRKQGIKTYVELKARMQRNLDLNRHRDHTVQYVDSYLGISSQGLDELGVESVEYDLDQNIITVTKAEKPTVLATRKINHYQEGRKIYSIIGKVNARDMRAKAQAVAIEMSRRTTSDNDTAESANNAAYAVEQRIKKRKTLEREIKKAKEELEDDKKIEE
ncbi:MAG: hypothetical protein WC346_05145 [Methanogenium sp.]|jgi:hypothetical protein